VLNFWRNRGVDGFLLSGVSYLVQDMNNLEEQNGTKNQPENIAVVGQLIRYVA